MKVHKFMMTDRARLLLVGLLFICVLFVMGCEVTMQQVLEVAGDNQEQLPVRSLTMSIPKEQRQQLFDQFQIFADKHDYEMVISDFGTNGKNFQIWISGADVEVIAGDIPPDPTLVFVRFYDQTRSTPVAEETQDTIMELALEIKSLVTEIPEVTILEER